MAAVQALGGRGQAEPIGREAALGRQRVGGAGQVMALVEHGEAEARAEVLHVEEGGVVGRDGDGLDAMVAAAEDADLPPEPLAQQPVPLPHEVEGGRHDDGVAAHRVHGQQRHLGLAGPRRQDDDPAPLRGPPRLDRLGLERSRLAAHPEAPVENAVAPGLVLVRDTAAQQRPHHRRIGGGRRAEPPGPRVPPAGVGQPRPGGPVEPADVERAGGETKADSHLEWRGAALIIRGAAAVVDRALAGSAVRTCPAWRRRCRYARLPTGFMTGRHSIGRCVRRANEGHRTVGRNPHAHGVERRQPGRETRRPLEPRS